MGNLLSEDEMLHMTMLVDFYGEILTDKQRNYLDLYYNEDLSLAEIAKKDNITRPGVFDIINRSRKTLIKMEHKTGIVARWMETSEKLEKAESITNKISELAKDNNKITDLTNELHSIIKEIKEL